MPEDERRRGDGPALVDGRGDGPDQDAVQHGGDLVRIRGGGVDERVERPETGTRQARCGPGEQAHDEKPGYQARLADCAEEATRNFLRELGMDMTEVDLLVPVPSAPRFLDPLRERLGVPGDRVAYVPEDLEGTHTTGPITAVQAAMRSGRLGEAGNTLMLAAGSGITVALALYRQTPA